jgi:hypothetical protein
MKKYIYFVTAGGAVGIQCGLIFSKITGSADFCYFSSGKVK